MGNQSAIQKDSQQTKRIQHSARFDLRQGHSGTWPAALRRGLFRNVVAAFGTHGEFVVAGGVGIDPNDAVTTGDFSIGGLVADGVLVANVVGNGFADLIDLIERLGKEASLWHRPWVRRLVAEIARLARGCHGWRCPRHQ